MEREALAKLGQESARVLGVAHRAGGDRGHDVGLERLIDGDVLADGLADVLDRLGGELARGVDAPPEPGDGGAPLELGDLRAVDVGDEQPRRVRSDVDDGDSHPLHPKPRWAPLSR